MLNLFMNIFCLNINEKELKIHEAEFDKINEILNEKMTANETSYDFLLQTPETIITDLCNELKGKSYFIECISSRF